VPVRRIAVFGINIAGRCPIVRMDDRQQRGNRAPLREMKDLCRLQMHQNHPLRNESHRVLEPNTNHTANEIILKYETRNRDGAVNYHHMGTSSAIEKDPNHIRQSNAIWKKLRINEGSRIDQGEAYKSLLTTVQLGMRRTPHGRYQIDKLQIVIKTGDIGSDVLAAAINL